MPIQVELIRENRAVLKTYTDPLDSSDLIALREKMYHEIFPNTVGKVQIISDFRAVKNPPTALTSSRVILHKAHPHTDRIICVTENPFVAIIAFVFANTSLKYPVKVVRSLEEAYREVDAILANGVD